MKIVATDKNQEEFKAELPFIRLDINKQNFSSYLGEGNFNLMTAVEVIEHLESPIGFLRNVRLFITLLSTEQIKELMRELKFIFKAIGRKI